MAVLLDILREESEGVCPVKLAKRAGFNSRKTTYVRSLAFAP